MGKFWVGVCWFLGILGLVYVAVMLSIGETAVGYWIFFGFYLLVFVFEVIYCRSVLAKEREEIIR